MKLNITRLITVPVLLCLCLSAGAWPFKAKAGRQQDPADTTKFVSPYAEDNERCLKCHGQSVYPYRNEQLGKDLKATMSAERIVKREKFYSSNHKSFSCTDCHSESYTTWPHAGELRMEQKLMCLDCHGGDETYAKYHFEEIESEYKQSTHFKMEGEGFSCWKCHDPHGYSTILRHSDDIRQTVMESNTICLNCHGNFEKFRLLTEKTESNLIGKHDWLPNQEAHFKTVRCIECHAAANDSLLVSHRIKPKEEAVRLCNECHSQNSILMSSLYKYRSRELRENNGFLNAVMLNESYVIGANRNEYLNLVSFIVFGLVVAAIAFHVVLRILKK
ncbi:MAG: cytochrome c3 family protein [Bacteroidales bacterium]